MPLKAVLFDLDGTLLDTAPDFVVVVNALLAEHNKPALPADLIRATVSNGARALVQLAFGLQEGEPGFEPLRLRLLELYSANLAVETRPFPGIIPLLEHLQAHDIGWGIATNKPEVYTTPLLSALSFPSPPGSVICPDHVTERKPHPESIYLACEQLACKPQEVVYIGDHQRDIACGNNAGVPTIGALYGYIEADDDPVSWRATHLVRHADEIWPLLQPYINADTAN